MAIEPNFYCDYGYNIYLGKNFYSNHNLVILDANKVEFGENVFVGASSTIIDNITICNNVIIGANSCVTKNIIEAGTYIGNPVKRIK